MGRVLTNNTALAYTIESALGVPGTTWKRLQPNSFKDWGAKTKRVERNPIDTNRQRQKGTIVDLDSAVAFETDLTLEAFIDFAEGFVFSTFKGGTVFKPTAVTATGYTVASGGALPDNTLVLARGFANAANNGLKVLAGTSTATEIKTTGLVVEAAIPPTQNATVEVCGFQFATGDAQINAGGNLITTTKDLTAFGLLPGQAVWVGDKANALFQFATAADYGLARVKAAVTTNLLQLDKKATTFSADTGTGKTIRLFYGRFVRNVATDHADFLERSFTFEAAFKNLATPGPGDEYEYAKGNYCNKLEFNLPLADKAAMSIECVGTTTDVPTGSRLSGAASPVVPVQNVALSTSSDIARLRVTEVDETGITTDFKALTFALNNNVSGEKVLGQLGPKYLNYGDFEVDMDANLIFTNSAVITAIRNNRTISMDFLVRNSDGAIYTDVPSMTLDDGGKEFPANESVNIKVKGMAHQDATFGHSVGISIFPYLPAA